MFVEQLSIFHISAITISNVKKMFFILFTVLNSPHESKSTTQKEAKDS